MTYKNILAIPQVPELTIWTKNGDFYWPDPTQVYLWNGEEFAQNSETVIADLPDHFHWHEDYVVNQPLLFTQI